MDVVGPLATSGVGAPLTGFSGTGGFSVGEIGGGGVTGSVPKLRTPHQLFSAIRSWPYPGELLLVVTGIGKPALAVVPSACTLIAP